MRVLISSALLSAVLLTGCVSTSPEERRVADERTCRDYGFRPRTVAFAECLQRIDLNRDADRRARFYGDDPFYGSRVGIGIGVGRGGPYW